MRHSWLLVFACCGIAACLKFPGAQNEACTSTGICSAGLVCVEGVCKDSLTAERESCAGKVCGVVGPFTCGVCASSSQTCRGYVCMEACAGKQCGMAQGMSCGMCTSTARCENDQCIPFCSGRCGDVSGHDCGGCANAGELCVNNACVDGPLQCSSERATPVKLSSNDMIMDSKKLSQITDYAAMCNGWIAIGTTSNQVSLLDAFGDAQPINFQLTESVASLAVDIANGYIFAALVPAPKLARINIRSGRIDVLDLTLPPNSNLRVQLGRAGRVFIVESTPQDHGLPSATAIIDSDRFALLNEAPLPKTADVVAVDPTQDQLFAIRTSTTTAPDQLYRFVLTSSSAWATADEVDLARGGTFNSRTVLLISPDGQHLIHFGQNQLIDYDAHNLPTAFGGFETGVNDPSAFAFTPDSLKVIAFPDVDGFAPEVWDVALHIKLTAPSRTFAVCDGSCNFFMARISPTGRTLYALDSYEFTFMHDFGNVLAFFPL